ncbi:nucleotidyltransferase [Sulfurisphaera ohwakuensis]|uniref:Nucleotidyltransferase n=1 Tax=Sulfurisphaera ohwakuensis TaxID=69656 RepID=A0A650CDN8_SULOH|nr:nucleotidyltransferase [Sulfurisphaera ohwakuensis]MBB5253202.1 hypothetical protein [Sulfurisphaera ohwakuensis]QGR15888.1 nucleotidyltransferase [Sulfurisphaera ohwakuensis]
MGRDYFLDKDLIISKDNNIYVVYSNINPFGYIYAYLKYIYTGKGIWKGYERVLRYYGVHNLLKVNQEYIYEPCYDVSFPILRKSMIVKHLKPEEKMRKIIRKSENKLESLALEIYDYVNIKNIGITGSLLAGISHENSDIDFVIYGIKDTIDFLESFQGFDEDKDWISETIKNYDISLNLAKDLYDRRVRGMYKGIKYSFLFVNDKVEKYCNIVCKRIGEGEIIANIDDKFNSLFYPSVVTLSNVSIIKGSSAPQLLVSYEGIYSMLLYKSNRVYVKGMLMRCEDGEVKMIIGDRDVKGYIRRIL